MRQTREEKDELRAKKEIRRTKTEGKIKTNYDLIFPCDEFPMDKYE